MTGWACCAGRRVALLPKWAFAEQHLFWPCRVVHLDLKSSNVLIAADGSAKISDVGLAALMSQNYLSQMAPAGTWSWVAPEVILGGNTCCPIIAHNL